MRVFSSLAGFLTWALLLAVDTEAQHGRETVIKSVPGPAVTLKPHPPPNHHVHHVSTLHPQDKGFHYYTPEGSPVGMLPGVRCDRKPSRLLMRRVFLFSFHRLRRRHSFCRSQCHLSKTSRRPPSFVSCAFHSMSQ